MTATGGTAPYTYAVIGRAAVRIDAVGKWDAAGTPEASGSFQLGVTATRQFGRQRAVCRDAQLHAGDRRTGLDARTCDAGQRDCRGGLQCRGLRRAAAPAPYAYAVTAGALPAGVTLAADGTLSGTTTAGGTYAFTVTATRRDRGRERRAVQRYPASIRWSWRHRLSCWHRPDCPRGRRGWHTARRSSPSGAPHPTHSRSPRVQLPSG
ncbi:hypothetical protein FSB78_00015 [Sphingomonas ginsenosidivorax]|uniref:MBG domain-containing protein n=1 Tax=Sphingomonas ginsenosidivorax TaxID=862135 RepID=A0A5C6UIZ3_9SPHN|nr:hypothetical protein FSB78_00015 [Sphingomonas ginsenosidivorax]